MSYIRFITIIYKKTVKLSKCVFQNNFRKKYISNKLNYWKLYFAAGKFTSFRPTIANNASVNKLV